MSQRTSLPVDYDQYAPSYATSRFAHPWVLEPLRSAVAEIRDDGDVLEIGCGTGNYIHALAEGRPELGCFGFDQSAPMLRVARSRGGRVSFTLGDAGSRFPYPDQRFALAFAVDVIHHIDDVNTFFVEAHRVLLPGGELVIATDSEETLRRRSLTRYFPEILEVELSRYPTIAALHSAAGDAGLTCTGKDIVEGWIPLDDEYVTKVEAKCASSMRLISSEQHAAGMVRVRAAAKGGEQWLSCYELLRYRRPE